MYSGALLWIDLFRTLIMANSNKCDIEIKALENYKNLVQSVTNRKQECQKTINKVISES